MVQGRDVDLLSCYCVSAGCQFRPTRTMVRTIYFILDRQITPVFYEYFNNERCHISPCSVGMYEPAIDILAALAKEFGVTIDYLVTGHVCPA